MSPVQLLVRIAFSDERAQSALLYSKGRYKNKTYKSDASGGKVSNLESWLLHVTAKPQADSSS